MMNVESILVERHKVYNSTCLLINGTVVGVTSGDPRERDLVESIGKYMGMVLGVPVTYMDVLPEKSFSMKEALTWV